MYLFNTLTQQKELLEPRDNLIRMYVCGVTPYDTTHLGHAFTYIVYDVLARYLEYRGHEVRYVQNVTDVDDDILRKAREVGINWKTLGDQETASYLADLEALHMRPFDVYAHATNEIPGMIILIEQLLAGGFAYVNEGNVYFSVARDSNFGTLARAIGMDTYTSMLSIANERGNYPDDPRKSDPLDFVLWQAQQAGEPAWPSPWGMGRPGWHIECSAMVMRYLGMQIDVHGGGLDLAFPHHACEIAQVENVTHVKPFVRLWSHVAMVHLNGEKMSKSLGNIVRIKDLLKEHSSDAVRILLLQHHYRRSWDYEAVLLEEAGKLATKFLKAVGEQKNDSQLGTPHPTKTEVGAAFAAAMEDDLNTPLALSLLERLADYILEKGQQKDELATMRITLKCLCNVLGLLC